MDPLTRLLMQGAAGAGGAGLGIEDVFSTWLYTGTGATQTITNGIDLAGEGGMVWIKTRDNPVSHALFDTSRGANRLLSSNGTSAETSTTGSTNFYSLSAFGATGFDLGPDQQLGWVNGSGAKFASWTFRKAPGFFDVVTWTGSGTGTTIVPHSLGSTPGCVIIKVTNGSSPWYFQHRSLTNGLDSYLTLNTTNAATLSGSQVSANSTSLTLGNYYSSASSTYVAYLFAHDEQIFGEGGDQSVIQCGSFTTDASGNATVSLGWEPQWVLHKRSSDTSNWNIFDSMRGVPTGGSDALLKANLSDAETASFDNIDFTSTGFQIKAESTNKTFIYIAIRRGPMKTPTSGTEVFAQETTTPTTGQTFTTNFPVDASISNWKSDGVYIGMTHDRLRGYVKTNTTGSPILQTSAISAESTFSSFAPFIYAADSNTSVKYGGNSNGVAMMTYAFRRAPGFFDVVAYNANQNVVTNIPHNLAAIPELMIFKVRSGGLNDWYVYAASLGNAKYLKLNTTDAAVTNTTWLNSTTPTSSIFTLKSFEANWVTYPHIAYLFATCPGVSKVFSYTGTGTTLQVDCGFTSGARLVLIKRTDSTGDWYIWDTARGITSSTDPYLLLNSTAAEVTGTDYIDPYSAGFEISSTAPAAINASGGSFIGLAIA